MGVLVVLVIILVSMTLHELAHGYVAYILGDLTAKEDGRLTLNPLKHLDPIMSLVLPIVSYLMGGVVFGGAKPVPVNTRNLKGGAWGMAAVALAGPLTNLLLALAAFLVGHYLGMLYGGGFWRDLMLDVIFINLGFGVFNMIPIPPLDGSRVLYVLMPDVIRGVMERMERIGLVVVYVLIFLGGGIFSSYMSTAINAILDGFYWIVGA